MEFSDNPIDSLCSKLAIEIGGATIGLEINM